MLLDFSKQKPYNSSQPLVFSNSDPLMIKLFLKWLREIIKVAEQGIRFELYIHESSRIRVPLVIDYWRKIIGNKTYNMPTYYKKDKIRSLRRNTGENYYGVLRIRVRRSTDMNRRVTGWIDGVCKNSRVV